MNLDFAYMKLPAPDIKDFMENARRCWSQWFFVTIPHKMAVIPFLSRLSPQRRQSVR
jgi:shikimate 5-dehydrogenase